MRVRARLQLVMHTMHDPGVGNRQATFGHHLHQIPKLQHGEIIRHDGGKRVPCPTCQAVGTVRTPLANVGRRPVGREAN